MIARSLSPLLPIQRYIWLPITDTTHLQSDKHRQICDLILPGHFLHSFLFRDILAANNRHYSPPISQNTDRSVILSCQVTFYSFLFRDILAANNRHYSPPISQNTDRSVILSCQVTFSTPSYSEIYWLPITDTTHLQSAKTQTDL